MTMPSSGPSGLEIGQDAPCFPVVPEEGVRFCFPNGAAGSTPVHAAADWERANARTQKSERRQVRTFRLDQNQVTKGQDRE